MIHPLTKHYSVLKSIPGVVGVQPTKNADGEGLSIQTETFTQARYLDDVIADSIKGRDVEFNTPSGQVGIPSPGSGDRYCAEDILRDYSQLLKGLPGVTYLGSMDIKVGEMLPAFDSAVEVVTESRSQAQFLGELLEPSVDGTRLLIRAEDQKFDGYGRISQN